MIYREFFLNPVRNGTRTTGKKPADTPSGGGQSARKTGGIQINQNLETIPEFIEDLFRVTWQHKEHSDPVITGAKVIKSATYPKIASRFPPRRQAAIKHL